MAVETVIGEEAAQVGMTGKDDAVRSKTSRSNQSAPGNTSMIEVHRRRFVGLDLDANARSSAWAKAGDRPHRNAVRGSASRPPVISTMFQNRQRGSSRRKRMTATMSRGLRRDGQFVMRYRIALVTAGASAAVIVRPRLSSISSMISVRSSTVRRIFFCSSSTP